MESPTAMPTESLTCLKRSRSITITVGRSAASVLAKPSTASSRSRNNSRLGRPVRLSCTASCSSRSSAVLNLGHVGQRADEADHFAVGSDHRPRLEREPQIMAVGGAQAEILGDAPAPLFQHAVERGAETVAVELMQHVEPFGGRAVERAAAQAERGFGLRAGEHFVGGDVPVPDHVAGAGQRQRAALDVRHDAAGRAARKGVLHHREADQHDDQDEAAEQRGADNVVGDKAQHRHRRGDHPDHQRGARSGSASRRGHSRGSRDRSRARSRAPRQEQRYARDAGGDGRREQRHRDQRAEEGEPAEVMWM